MEGEVVEDAEVVGGQGYIVGSMDYIAPEQTEDATAVDARADIYSMGCSIYFALTGRPPFPGGKNREKMRRHREEDPEPLERLNPAVSEKFAAVVRQMMAKNPSDRFSSAFAAREELLPWAVNEPTMPLDQPGDQSYREAIIALEKGDTPPEMGELIIAKSEMPADLAGQINGRDGPPAPSGARPRLRYWWLVLGLLGIWVILAAALALAALWIARR
jgi:serine/threonine protein kinase